MKRSVVLLREAKRLKIEITPNDFFPDDEAEEELKAAEQ